MGEDAFTGNKSTRTFDAALAQKIGLNEAIVLSQIRYWVDRNREADRNYHDGKYWVYNTFEQWQEQFPWWSVRTLKSVFKSLENNGYIVAGHYNQKGYDRTKWYTLSEEMTSEPAENLIVQNLHDQYQRLLQRIQQRLTIHEARWFRPTSGAKRRGGMMMIRFRMRGKSRYP